MSLKEIEKGIIWRILKPVTFTCYSIYAVIHWLVFIIIVIVASFPLVILYGSDRGEEYLINIADWFCDRNKLMDAFRKFNLPY